ncbi:alpha/beta fold hydrolase [Nocardioides humi]|uniref:AB hydrolase-1 domain-containing protein n=1 Tax=Nocardioides humi TaxID=449461 RepID=A0ABN1ZY91_9ACTN|nr:alpha/beta hydrolase [Nocardioides humi]
MYPTTVEANGVTLGIEQLGDPAAPLVLCVGGPTMLSWPDRLCAALARGAHRVVRYDLRDAGASLTLDPDAPSYTLRDLAADAAALARELDDRPAHLAGIGVGGMVAQVAALDHPDAFCALTLAGTRPVAPGPVDDDLPDHDAATMERLFGRPMPDWSDREAVTDFAADGAAILGDDPAAARAAAARIWDRTPGTAPAVQLANQLGMVFSRLDCGPRWRERLPGLAMPTLVVHGRRDPFFPVGNGEALAREIPGARLLVLEGASTRIPDAAAEEVATAMQALDRPPPEPDDGSRTGQAGQDPDPAEQRREADLAGGVPDQRDRERGGDAEDQHHGRRRPGPALPVDGPDGEAPADGAERTEDGQDDQPRRHRGVDPRVGVLRVAGPDVIAQHRPGQEGRDGRGDGQREAGVHQG